MRYRSSRATGSVSSDRGRICRRETSKVRDRAKLQDRTGAIVRNAMCGRAKGRPKPLASAAHVMLPRSCVKIVRLAPRSQPERLDELVRLQDEHRGAQRARSLSFTAAALLSIAWWPRARAVDWLPAHLVDLALALWSIVLAMAVACSLHEWRLGRRFDRLAATRPVADERES
jgi:hypothetical protein